MNGHTLRARLRPKRWRLTPQGKWSLAQQARLCQLLADQLRSGFSLKQALAFLRTTAEDLPPEVTVIEQHLLAGAAFLPELAPYLQENIYFQLTLTTHDGSLCLGLARAAKLLQLMATQRQRLRQLLAYPLGLFGGMGLLFATLQFGILPQLRTSLAPQTTGPRLTWQVWSGGLLGVSLLLLGGPRYAGGGVNPVCNGPKVGCGCPSWVAFSGRITPTI